MRQRSSSRCAVRGMRTSCSGPTRPGTGVSGAARLRLRGGGRGRGRGRGRRRTGGRCRLGRALRRLLLEHRLDLELVHDVGGLAAELGHRLAERARHLREPLRTEHHERDHEDHEELGHPDPEHRGAKRREKGGWCQFTARDLSAIVGTMAGGTAVVVDRRMLAHDPGRGHPERPDRLRVLLDHLADARGLVQLGARAATAEELALIHPAAHVERGAASAGRSHVVFDPDTATSAGSWEAARLAAGSLLVLCEAILGGEVENGFALVRPPGHHAERDRAMGFCLFNNVAVATAWLRQQGVGRVAIVDWDLHHGNGTQHLFESDPEVLYVSTHQYPYYPGTGAADEVGRGPGVGRTLNLPFPAGFGDAEYIRAFTEVVAPVLRQFAPGFVLVSAGFDCDHRDPLGGMEVTPAGFAAMARACVELAGECARGRLAAVLEGGYDLAAIVEGVDATLAAMRGAERPPPPLTGDARPAEPVLAPVRAAQAPYWLL